MSLLFPDDETGELLRLMQEQGDDLSAARDVDFFLVFETRGEADRFVAQADIGPEFRVATSPYERTGKWQVTLTVNMVPLYAELVALEKQVARLARPHRGDPDGWGCQNVPKGTGHLVIQLLRRRAQELDSPVSGTSSTPGRRRGGGGGPRSSS